MVSWRALERWDFDAIVLSPGPGRPDRWHDFGVCSDILRSSEIPVFGVCLGHQGLGYVLSGIVETAPEAMHGRLSHVQHTGTGLFADVKMNFDGSTLTVHVVENPIINQVVFEGNIELRCSRISLASRPATQLPVHTA